MKEKTPSYILLLPGMALIVMGMALLFNIIDKTKTASNPNFYWFVAFSIVLLLFAVVVYLFRILTEDEWELKYKKSSAYRRDMYRQQLHLRLGGRRKGK